MAEQVSLTNARLYMYPLEQGSGDETIAQSH